MLLVRTWISLASQASQANDVTCSCLCDWRDSLCKFARVHNLSLMCETRALVDELAQSVRTICRVHRLQETHREQRRSHAHTSLESFAATSDIVVEFPGTFAPIARLTR